MIGCIVAAGLATADKGDMVTQVYEREAICNHLRRSCSDPVTRQELPGLSLTPIYLLRSRATDYREQTCASRSCHAISPVAAHARLATPMLLGICHMSYLTTSLPASVYRSARACLEAACSLSYADPAKYVRRAAELCASLPAPVPGLSAECAAYVASHPSNAFDEGVVQARLSRRPCRSLTATVTLGIGPSVCDPPTQRRCKLSHVRHLLTWLLDPHIDHHRACLDCEDRCPYAMHHCANLVQVRPGPCPVSKTAILTLAGVRAWPL